MNNIDIRAYIISNFKEDNIEEIRNSIEESIASHDEDPLIGLGVLFLTITILNLLRLILCLINENCECR